MVIKQISDDIHQYRFLSPYIFKKKGNFWQRHWMNEFHPKGGNPVIGWRCFYGSSSEVALKLDDLSMRGVRQHYWPARYFSKESTTSTGIIKYVTTLNFYQVRCFGGEKRRQKASGTSCDILKKLFPAVPFPPIIVSKIVWCVCCNFVRYEKLVSRPSPCHWNNAE